MAGDAFVSSQRKANHNRVFEEGMTMVTVDGDTFYATGRRKPSVGARSQWLLLEEHPGYDCVVHTHNPLREGSTINTVSQREFQCGSLECGLNTKGGMVDYDGIKAVYLDKHGANILFRSQDWERVLAFITANIELGVKVGRTEEAVPGSGVLLEEL